jgi:hypothetical protein
MPVECRCKIRCETLSTLHRKKITKIESKWFGDCLVELVSLLAKMLVIEAWSATWFQVFDNAEKGVSTAFLRSGWSLIFNSGQCEPSTAEGRGMLLVIESGVVEMENVFGRWFTIEFPELLCVGRILLIWCRTLSHHHFCTTGIGRSNFTRILIPLTKML